MNSKIKLWIVGSIGIDDIKTKNADKKNLLGGSLPFSTIAASFFAKTGAVGVVGTDFPAAFDRKWSRFGIDLSGVQREPGATFRWGCEYDPNMIERKTLRTELGVFERFSPSLPADYKKAPFILLGNIQPDLQSYVLDQAEAPKFVALDTMDFWMETALPSLKKIIKRVDLITINDSEARRLSGKWNLRDCASEILKLGPKYVVIKKGEHGAMLFTKDSIAIIPAYPVRTLADPTGAGDTYAGAFMGCLAKAGAVTPELLRDALLTASVVASFGVEKFSIDRFASLDSAEIKSRLAELKRMI